MSIITPVVSSKVSKDRGYTLVAHADTLNDENYVHITEDATGESIIVPSRFLKLMNGTLSILSDLASKKQVIQREANHPVSLFPDTLTLINRNDPNKIILTGANASVIGTPMLTWVSETSRNIHEKTGEGPDSPLQAAGWRLELAGLVKAPLGFAKWDDTAGIKTLVSQMDNTSALSVQLVLSKPIQAQILYASETLTRLIKEGHVPLMLQKEVKKSFIEARLNKSTKTAKIIRLEVPTDGVYSTIAIGILKNPSEYWRWQDQAHIQNLQGWTEVTINPENSINLALGGRTPKWITRLTQEQWNSIETSIKVRATVGKGNVWI